jgi:long-subunit acyl-CoA synthetase (AMP-forming)
MTASVTADREKLRRTTALHLLCERARTMADSVAFRSKHLGIYRERRWHDYALLVAQYAHALQHLGLKRANGRRSWATFARNGCCDLAVQSLRAIAMAFIRQHRRQKLLSDALRQRPSSSRRIRICRQDLSIADSFPISAPSW